MIHRVTLTCIKPPQYYRSCLFCFVRTIKCMRLVHCVPPASYAMTSPLCSVRPILVQVWVTMFARLLKDPLIPSIVVPEGYPNESTWRLLRQSVPTEVTGSILTCQHDISAEWRTYYDYRWVTMVTELIPKLDSCIECTLEVQYRTTSTYL